MVTEAAQEERVAELTDAYLEQVRSGHALSVEEYAAQHPDCSAELQELLPLMLEVEGAVRETTRPVLAEAASYPETLGGYRLSERIGSGGMGTVFRAMQESLHREVAVKILSPAWSSDARHCEAFENESRVIAALHHTNIVEVFGAGREGDYRYYVMSLIKGRAVSPSRVREVFPGQPYERAVALVGRQAARALAYAHSCRVLHRDVKPGNLLLDADGVLHVSDFGLATVLNGGENAPLVTQSHDGTLRYMAPERLTRGENSYAGDQYSLGLTLYELLQRRPAFTEEAPGTLIRRICDAPLPPLQGEGELGAIINKSVNYDPADRYDSVAEMEADLRRYLEGEPVQARPASCLRRYVLWLRRRPAVALWSHAAALLVMLLVISLSVGYVRETRSLRAENEQRVLAERNASIADAALQRIFSGMVGRGEPGSTLAPPTKADTRLLQDLMPYYEEIVGGEAHGGETMGQACFTLASLAARTDDNVTAEIYFRRAAELLPSDSADQLRALNGLALALRSQSSPEKQQEAEQLLRRTVNRSADSVTDELRPELVRALLLLGKRPMPPIGQAEPRGSEGRGPRNNAGRSAAYRQEERRRVNGRLQRGGREGPVPEILQAARLLRPLLEKDSVAEETRLLQLELMMAAPGKEVAEALGCRTTEALTLVRELLEQEPENERYRRAFAELVLRPLLPGQQGAAALSDMERAAEYARDLLASHPTDSDLLALYIFTRNHYTAALERKGQKEQAARAREQTLGALSLVTSRSDFSPEVREKLALLVSLQPEAESKSSRREEEISLLLHSMDEARKQELRRRLQRMREDARKHHRMNRGGGFFPPAPAAAAPASPAAE